MMCPKCGVNLSNDARFCIQCGKNLRGSYFNATSGMLAFAALCALGSGFFAVWPMIYEKGGQPSAVMDQRQPGKVITASPSSSRAQETPSPTPSLISMPTVPPLRERVGDGKAFVDYDSRRAERDSAIAVYNLFPAEYSSSCAKASWVGKIVKIKYGDNGVSMDGIGVVDAEGERDYVNFDFDELSMVDLEWMPHLIKEGRRIQLFTYHCGAAGRVAYLHHLKLLDR